LPNSLKHIGPHLYLAPGRAYVVLQDDVVMLATMGSRHKRYFVNETARLQRMVNPIADRIHCVPGYYC
jgi:hypothetical protein